MSKYGEIINDMLDKDNNIQLILNEYFNNPTMIKLKNVELFSMYSCKLYCLLNRECRYIMVLKEQDNYPVGTALKLKDINWVSFQTRTLTDNHDLPVHGYTQNRTPILLSPIIRVNKNEEISEYVCDKFPKLKFFLLHKKNINDYQDKGTILSALETFQTIIMK